MHNGKDSKFTGSVALLTAAVTWGFGYVVIADSLNSLSVYTLMSSRYILAALGMLLIFYRSLYNMTFRIVREGALLGLALYLSQLVQTIACGLTTAGKVSFITALYVVLVPLIGVLLFRQKISPAVILSVILAIPGLLLLTGAEGGMCRGDLLALAGSIGFAVHMLFSDRFARRDNITLLSTMQFLSAAIYSTTVQIIAGKPIITGMDFSSASRIVFLGLLSTLTGFFLQMWGQERVSATLAAVLLSTEALFGLLFSAIFLNERMTVSMIVGCVLLLFAILIAELGSEQ